MSSVKIMPAVSKTAGPFSQQTADALCSLVLRLCAHGSKAGVSTSGKQRDHTRACQDPSSTWLSETLALLAEQDANFAVWCTEHLTEAEQVADVEQIASTEQSAPGFACALTMKLLSTHGWRSEQCDASERLWQILNVAVRLDSLENQFEQALEARKREAIYHFAYGLSHELNNPLANIATRAGVLLHAETAADRRLLLETIIDNSMRGSEMLGDLMLLARPPRISFEWVDVASWFAGFVAHASGWAARRGAQIVASSDLSAERFHFDPVAIREALWCLVRNSLEVTGEGGVVEVLAANCGDELKLTVRDSGPGLSDEVLKHCFDPYYSGREAGRGLGLGLSKAARIADLHQGEVRIANRIPMGCEATLRIRKNAAS